MRSNRDKDLENIINEMYTHKIEAPADNTVEETGCNTKREDTEDVDDLQALHDNPDEEFAKKNYGSVQAYKDMLKKKIEKLQTLNAAHCN